MASARARISATGIEGSKTTTRGPRSGAAAAPGGAGGGLAAVPGARASGVRPARARTRAMRAARSGVRRCDGRGGMGGPSRGCGSASTPLCPRSVTTATPREGPGSAQRVEQGLGDGRDVVGVAAGDEVAVDDDLLVDPLAAAVADVGLQARPAGEALALDPVGLDEGPGCVADGGDGL